MKLDIFNLRNMLKPIGHGHDIPPLDFLQIVRDYIFTAPAELFARDADRRDIYAILMNNPDLHNYVLTSATGQLPRRALMFAALIVLAGDESDWKWNTGADSTAVLKGEDNQEAGAFQVSYDSRALDTRLRKFLTDNGIYDGASFRARMKQDHRLAVAYAALLISINTAWDGPANRGWIAAQVTPQLVEACQKALMP